MAQYRLNTRLFVARDLDTTFAFFADAGNLQRLTPPWLDFRILTPWKEPHERPKGWDPDIDDGVKVNIEPLQKAGVLRLGKVV